MVELNPTNAKAHGTFVLNVHGMVVANDTDAKSNDRLKCSRQAVVVDIDLEVLDDLWRDPASADFVTREGRLVHNDDIESRMAKLPGAGRAGRTATHHQDVASVHDQPSAISSRASRARPACAPARTAPETAGANQSRTTPGSRSNTGATHGRIAHRTSIGPGDWRLQIGLASVRAFSRSASGGCARRAPTTNTVRAPVRTPRATSAHTHRGRSASGSTG